MLAEGPSAGELLQLGVERGVKACLGVLEKMGKAEAIKEKLIEVHDEAVRPVGYLEVHALGRDQVLSDGRALASSDWQTSVTKELFFYFLMHTQVDRRDVGLAFWPDLPAGKVSNQFHVSLHRLRGALGANVVVSVGEGVYRIGDFEYWFDVEEFEEVVERARLLPPYDPQSEHLWNRAVSLYGGDFLPGAERSWCVPRRESLRDMFIEALVALGRCHETRQEYKGAIEWYRRALEVDDLREDIHLRVMTCFQKVGQRAAALVQYRHCQEVLERELGMQPSAELQRLAADLAGGSGPGARPKRGGVG
jgi:two-component SAPR family response regulator